MADLADGETTEMKGSGAKPYVLRNTGGVYSCSCPAWRNQSVAIERRTCKHLKKLRGDAVEAARVGAGPALRPAVARKGSGDAGADDAGGAEEGEAGPPLLLAHSWDNAADLTGWWMSEKLDGVRAYWDGQRFLSRLGNPYHAPDWFVERLPPTPLDGELWGGRKRFQRTVSIARRQDRSEQWKELAFVVFDAPALDGPFEERLASVREHVDAHRPPHARHHEHLRCEGLAHLRSELARVERLGGEGLMLRQPGSRYEAGRSPTLLKVKSFRDDEARVLQHLPGEGRHKGRLGAVLVELRDGTRFSIGTGFSDAERRAPPAIGSVVTFRYQELSEGGVPRFPTYVGVRDDAELPALEEDTLNLTSEQVLALATDPASAAAARKLAVPKPWKNLGQSDRAMWGECQGSALYQVRVDLSDMATKCSCPSRKFPCKHALALLLLAATSGGSFATGGHPEWVSLRTVLPAASSPVA